MEQHKKSVLEKIVDYTCIIGGVGIATAVVGMGFLPVHTSPLCEYIKDLPVCSDYEEYKHSEEFRQSREKDAKYASALISGGFGVATIACIVGTIAANIYVYRKNKKK